VILGCASGFTKITDFAVWNDEGDYTQDMFAGKKLFLIIYNISKTNKESYSDIVNLQKSLDGQVEVIALTASDAESFKAFQNEIGLNTPFYYTDATVLKTIARSNPGLWLMDNGLVKGKWHFNDVPDYSRVLDLVGM